MDLRFNPAKCEHIHVGKFQDPNSPCYLVQGAGDTRYRILGERMLAFIASSGR